ncbi:MAG: acetate--CoA ligase, partial [Chloroflexota bacterium]
MADQDFVQQASELYPPSEDIVQNANVPDYDAVYKRSIEDNEAFWAERAEELEWYEKWDTVLDDSEAPFYKWFTGGKTNMVLNALDRHLHGFRRNKLALIWEGEPGDQRTYSYTALAREVNKFANVLRSMGVKKGDTVTIYMGRVPEIMIAMLACAKIGAPHSVVYGGFSDQALADRIADAKSKVVVTCDGSWLRGKIVKLKDVVDEAVKRSPVVQSVIVYQRTGHDINMEQGRDYWWHDLMKLPIASPYCETEVMDAEDPLFILYTSGTTGKPKGILHTHGGYQVYTSTTLSWVFDIKDEDRWWCAADPGWITGHSYIVYGPLANGATTVMFEGVPTYPDAGRFWRIVDKHQVNIFYTAPTAIRALMRENDAFVTDTKRDSLRLLGTVGEPINPEAWRWYHRVVGDSRCPIVDTWWQTETGGVLISPLPYATDLKPGS